MLLLPKGSEGGNGLVLELCPGESGPSVDEERSEISRLFSLSGINPVDLVSASHIILLQSVVAYEPTKIFNWQINYFVFLN